MIIDATPEEHRALVAFLEGTGARESVALDNVLLKLRQPGIGLGDRVEWIGGRKSGTGQRGRVVSIRLDAGMHGSHRVQWDDWVEGSGTWQHQAELALVPA